MDLGITVAAILNLGLWSFLIGDNPGFRLVQSLYVGAAVAHTFVLAYRNTLIPNLWEPLLAGKYVLLIPMALGLLLFTRVSKKHSYLSKVPLSFIVGIGAALAIRGAVFSDLAVQIASAMVPLTTVSNIIMLVGTICTLIYFTFTFKPTPVTRPISTLGRYIMMAAFGAAFGNTVMVRMSLLIGRLQFLWGDWLHLIK